MRCEQCDGLGSIVSCVWDMSDIPGHVWCIVHKSHECWIFGVTRIPCPECYGSGVAYCCDKAGTNDNA